MGIGEDYNNSQESGVIGASYRGRIMVREKVVHTMQKIGFHRKFLPCHLLNYKVTFLGCWDVSTYPFFDAS